jgi:hypothetical protein
MKLIATTFLVVAALTGSPLVGAARGGELGSDASKGAPLAAKINQDIDRAVSGGAGTTPADIDSRIQDLEATRTALDQKRPSPVSLSVSGFVSQEVQYNARQ